MRLPEGWGSLSLDNAAKIIDCKHRTPIYVEEGVPLVSPGTIKWGAIDLESPTKKVSFDEYQSLMDHCTVDIGDLVLSRNQSIGIASYVDKKIPFVLGQDTVLVKPIKTVPKFLFYFLQSTHTQKRIYELSGGSTFSRINLGDIRKLKVDCPPLPEQQKIAQILSTWDKAIEKLEALIAAKQKRKKALMQQLLTGKKRFAGFEEDWQKVKLGDICTIESSTSKSEFIDKSGNQLIIDMGSISREGKLIPSKRTSLSKDYLVIGQLVMPKDDIGGGNIIGRTAYIDKNDKYILGDHVYKLTVIKNNDSLFLSYLINSDFVNKSLRRKANGTAQLGLGKKDVSKQIIFLPSEIKEQQKIAAVLSTADKELETHQNHLAALKQQKQGLMQQLLTGKKRVKVD